MPRDNLLKGRISETNRVYHITVCTENRRPWFQDIGCGRLVVKQMRLLQQQQSVLSLAWVVMPDHVHWLLQLGDTQTLSQAIKTFKDRTAVELNRYLQHLGSLWQRGFHDHALRQAEDMRQIARYIIANPLRAKLVEHIGDYPLWDTVWL